MEEGGGEGKRKGCKRDCVLVSVEQNSFKMMQGVQDGGEKRGNEVQDERRGINREMQSDNDTGEVKKKKREVEGEDGGGGRRIKEGTVEMWRQE